MSVSELSLKAGELVYLTHRLDYHWYLAQAGGNNGLVPAAYLEIISSSTDGALPPVPSWALQTREAEMDTDDNRENKETKKPRKTGGLRT